MRLLLAGTAAAAFAFAATPAFAQFGGSPDQQVDGAPNAAQPAPGDEDADQAALPDDQAAIAPDEGAADDMAAGKPGADEAGPAEDAQADVDADVDADQANVDADADVNAEVDQGNAEADVDADAAASADQANVDTDVDADVDQDADADSEDTSGDVDADQGYEDQEGEPGAGTRR